jgi:hypothetical protein
MLVDFDYIFGHIKFPSDKHLSLLKTVLVKFYNGCDMVNIKLIKDTNVSELSANEWKWLENKYLAYSKTSTDHIKQIKRHLVTIEKALKNLPLNSLPNMAALRYLEKAMDLSSFNVDLQFSYRKIQNASENFTPYFDKLLESQLNEEWVFEKNALSWKVSTLNDSRLFKSYLSISFADNLDETIIEVQIVIYLGPHLCRKYQTFWKLRNGKWICILQHLNRLS